MSDDKNKTVRNFANLEKVIGPEANDRFAVRTRGRPETDPIEAREKMDRREAFGSFLKGLRLNQKLTLAAAAEAAGLASARKLSQYETTCYPPGRVLIYLAPVYDVSEMELAYRKIAASDPELFAAISGNRSIEEYLEITQEQ